MNTHIHTDVWCRYIYKFLAHLGIWSWPTTCHGGQSIGDKYIQKFINEYVGIYIDTIHLYLYMYSFKDLRLAHLEDWSLPTACRGGRSIGGIRRATAGGNTPRLTTQRRIYVSD